jgi:hypothetical protein
LGAHDDSKDERRTVRARCEHGLARARLGTCDHARAVRLLLAEQREVPNMKMHWLVSATALVLAMGCAASEGPQPEEVGKSQDALQNCDYCFEGYDTCTDGFDTCFKTLQNCVKKCRARP